MSTPATTSLAAAAGGPPALEGERMAVLGRLTRSVLHELSNPVSAVLAFSQILLSQSRSSEDQEALRHILQSATQCKQLIARLQAFSHIERFEGQAIDVGRLLREFTALAEIALKVHPTIALRVTLPAHELWARGSWGQVLHALMHLAYGLCEPLRAGSLSVHAVADADAVVLEMVAAGEAQLSDLAAAQLQQVAARLLSGEAATTVAAGSGESRGRLTLARHE